MRRLLAVFLAMAALGALPATPTRAAEPAAPLARKDAGDTELFDATVDAAHLIESGNYQAAYDRLKPLASEARLARAPAALQYDARVALGGAALNVGRASEAVELYERLVQSPLEDGYGLYLLASAAAVDPTRIDTGADAITRLARTGSEWLFNLHPDTVRINYARVLSLPDGGDRQIAMAKALLDANWNPALPFDDFSDMWVEIAAALLEQGDERGAAKATLNVSDPYEIIRMRADKRFDAIVRSNEGSFDPRRAALSNVDILRRESGRHPDDLRGVVALAGALTTIGKPQEALDIVNAALEAGQIDPTAFPEWNTHELWLLHAKAVALSSLGRPEEALKVYYDVASMPEYGGGNTSHALNYGSELVEKGHPKEALAAIDPVGWMTPYGETVKLWISICAHTQLGEGDIAQHEWAELKVLEKHSPSAVYTAAVCLDDLDAAAGILIRQLQDPDLRGPALYQLQHFDPPSKSLPSEPRTASQILAARYKAVESRADVLAEVEKVGRIERYDLRAEPN